MIGEPPEIPKYFFVVAPHTSNWDFVYGWMAIQALGLKVKLFAKDSFFVFPLNYICKMFGVLPVNRRERTNFVDSVAQLFDEHDRLTLLITPEGTRSFVPNLKSGYYHIAQKANVPIVLAGPNFKDKSFTILPPREPMATFEEDQANLIAFTKTQYGKNPHQSFTPNSLENEEE